MKRGGRARTEWLAPAVLLLAALSAWEAGARAGVVSSLYFPAPTVVALTLSKLASAGTLAEAVSATLMRLAAGFLLGGTAGLLLGLLMGWFRGLRAALDPLLWAAHPIPKIAILPLVLIIFGIGEVSRVLMVSIAAFFPMAVNTMAGVRQISPIHFEVAQNYGASRLKTFSRVVLPGSLPLVLAGTRIAFNVALLVTIAVELIAAHEGVGALLWMARETLRTEELYAGLFVIATIGIGFNLALDLLRRRIVPWQPPERS